MPKEIKNLAILGAGQMGGGIAQIAAQVGIDVTVFDTWSEGIDRCKALRMKLWARAVEKGKITQDEAADYAAKITYTQDLDAIAGADWVVEAVVEDMAVKADLFSKMAQMFTDDNVVLATNTSSISITEIATTAGDAAHRVVGMHFFNPVPVMKLVEVIKGLQTSDEVVERTFALAERLGKTPMKANDRAGFVSNRVLMPMINEAFYALMEGVAEAEAIDGIMMLGCAHPMGPLRLADFIGLDTCVNIMNVIADGLNNDRYRACPLLKQYVAAGRLGDKTKLGVYDYSK